MQELVHRIRGKKERRAANKLKEADTLGRSTPASNVCIGCKGKKDKGNMIANDCDDTLGVASKRKCAMKSMLVTPQAWVIDDDDDDERDVVS